MKDFIFNSTMVKPDFFWVKEKIKLKDFIFYKYICKVYILADIKRNCKKSRFI